MYVYCRQLHNSIIQIRKIGTMPVKRSDGNFSVIQALIKVPKIMKCLLWMCFLNCLNGLTQFYLMDVHQVLFAFLIFVLSIIIYKFFISKMSHMNPKIQKYMSDFWTAGYNTSETDIHQLYMKQIKYTTLIYSFLSPTPV